MKRNTIVILILMLFIISKSFARNVNQAIYQTSEIDKDSIIKNEKDTVTSQSLYHITKNNNTEYVGNLLSDDGREVLILTENLGKVYIPKSEIRSIEKIENKKSIIRGEYYDAGPFGTRYAFTTNALPMKKGSNYALLNLYGPEAHFALSDNLSVGILTTWLASPFVGDIKYSFKTNNEKIHLSIGGLIGTSGYINTFKGYMCLPFGNITFGEAKKNFTLAAGYSYFNTGYRTNNNSETNTSGTTAYTAGPVISIAGITKVGQKASFIFDSMVGFIHNNSSESVVAMLLMPGMRFQTSEKKAFQVSLAGVTVITKNDGTFAFPLPMCTWFYKF